MIKRWKMSLHLRRKRMSKNNETPVAQRMFKHDDYRRLMQIRVLEQDEEQSNGKMIIEGRAVVFDEPTVLFTFDGVDYSEIIARGAFDEADISKCYLKYNHSDNIMAMARVKNGTLSLDMREDGVWIKAELADTTAGRDLFTLIRRGDIDRMSFAFTIREESYDEKLHTWTVQKVDKLYDVAAVEQPAYENTQLYARRLGEVESRRAEVEALELARMRARVRLSINK